MATVLLQDTNIINHHDVYRFLQALHLFQIELTFVKEDDKDIIQVNKIARENDTVVFVHDEKTCIKRLEMIRPKTKNADFDDYSEIIEVMVPIAQEENVFQLFQENNLMLYIKPYGS